MSLGFHVEMSSFSISIINITESLYSGTLAWCRGVCLSMSNFISLSENIYVFEL